MVTKKSKRATTALLFSIGNLLETVFRWKKWERECWVWAGQLLLDFKHLCESHLLLPSFFHFSHFAHRWRRRKIFHPSSTHIFPEKKKSKTVVCPWLKALLLFWGDGGWKGGGEMSRRIFNPDPEPTASVDRRSLWSRQGKKVFFKKLHRKRFDKHFFSQKMQENYLQCITFAPSLDLHFCTLFRYVYAYVKYRTKIHPLIYMFKPWPICRQFLFWEIVPKILSHFLSNSLLLEPSSRLTAFRSSASGRNRKRGKENGGGDGSF